MPSAYCDRAYNEVMTWTARTRIAYEPNRKSGKSFYRYEKYMKARTVGESLALGSYGLDLLFDYEKGLLRPIGGPKRERPPNIEKMHKEELKKMSPTDRMLGKMYAKWHMWKSTFAALEAGGVTRKELQQMQGDIEGGKDSIVVAIGRKKAQERARDILTAVHAEGGRRVTDEEVLSCLRLWGFNENGNRPNVTPEGQTFVHSDTLGIVKLQTCEVTLLTRGSRRYPDFTKLCTQWLKDRIPPELKKGFVFTSININKNYAGRLHRDGNNVGPSMIKAFGDFTGGELNYWPADDKKKELEDFDQREKITVSLKDNLMMFDGNRGHCVNAFEGERYSLVFFSIRTWNKVPEQDAKDAAEMCGIPLPKKESMAHLQGLLGPGPAGYRLWPAQDTGAAELSTPQKRGRKRAADSASKPVRPPAKPIRCLKQKTAE